MTIDSKPFGSIHVDDRQRLLFPDGLFGFEDLTRFALLDSAQPPFYWLQSTDRSDTAFVLIEPALFRPDYTLDLAPGEIEEIGIDESESALVFSIVTIPEDQARMTANLQGPIVINKRTMVGRQTITTNPVWRVRHYVLDELAAVRNRAC